LPFFFYESVTTVDKKKQNKQIRKQPAHEKKKVKRKMEKKGPQISILAIHSAYVCMHVQTEFE